LNILAAIAILLSYLAVYISPIDFYGFAFLGLIYSYLLLANIIFIVFWIFFKSKKSIVSLVAILLGWSSLTSFLQFNFNTTNNAPGEQEIKVLSYNVRVFNRWNWSSEKNRGIKAINFIKRTKSNIVCLQEFYSSDMNGKNTVDSIMKNSSLQNVHVSYATKKNKIYHHGIATFTSYPIVNKGKVKLKRDENFCIYTDVQIDKDTIRVYNLHLESIHLGYDDYHLIESINNSDTLDVKGIRNILSKLKRGYQKRARQANVIAAHIETCRYPVILCGDFNDTPISYVYKRLTKNMKDAFREAGNGIGSTYINKFSTFRIDFLLHSPVFRSFNYHTPQVELSDHYPVQCSIQFK